jgi:hypothetical protein
MQLLAAGQRRSSEVEALIEECQCRALGALPRFLGPDEGLDLFGQQAAEEVERRAARMRALRTVSGRRLRVRFCFSARATRIFRDWQPPIT